MSLLRNDNYLTLIFLFRTLVLKESPILERKDVMFPVRSLFPSQSIHNYSSHKFLFLLHFISLRKLRFSQSDLFCFCIHLFVLFLHPVCSFLSVFSFQSPQHISSTTLLPLFIFREEQASHGYQPAIV